jgi:metal-sulfur cluster biosynthetic enzyme
MAEAIETLSEALLLQLQQEPIEVVKMETVREAMNNGSRNSVVPFVPTTYNKHAADQLNGQVRAAIQKA